MPEPRRPPRHPSRLFMTRLDAIVVPPRRPLIERAKIGGLPILERTVLALDRAGLERIVVAGARHNQADLVQRLARRGVEIDVMTGEGVSAVRPGHAAVIISTDVVFEPAAVAALVSRGLEHPGHAVCAKAALGGILSYLPADVVDRLREHPSVRQAMWLLYRGGLMAIVDIGLAFCRPVPPDGRMWNLEAEDIRRRAASDGFLARAMGLLSVPTSQILLRLRVAAGTLRLLVPALALTAALQLSRGGQLSWLFAALLLAASVLSACSAKAIEGATFARQHATATPDARRTRADGVVE